MTAWKAPYLQKWRGRKFRPRGKLLRMICSWGPEPIHFPQQADLVEVWPEPRP